METTEKAKAYVASQSEAFANAIEKAYMQGYNDAVEENSKEHIKIVEDGVEYFDLGLPSGTLWALKNPKLVSYHESQKLNIPTIEQIRELIKYIRWEIGVGDWNCGWRFTIYDAYARMYSHPLYNYTKGSNMEDGEMYMWCRLELDDNGNAKVFHLYDTHSFGTINCFPGYKAFAFFVK